MTEIDDVLGTLPDTEPFRAAMARLAERDAKQQADRNELYSHQGALINAWQPVIVRVLNNVNP